MIIEEQKMNHFTERKTRCFFNWKCSHSGKEKT